MVNSKRFALCLLVLLTALPGVASAGGLTRELVCDMAPDADYVEQDLATTEAFSANVEKNTIFINPRALTTRPQPVVNYEFAVACLRVARQRDDMCSVVRFMRERNLLFSDDLEVLQNYFVSRARSTKDPDESDRFYLWIKEMYSCY